MSFSIVQDQYIAVSPKRCDVEAKNDQVASEIWFTTPALDQRVIDHIVSVRLETKSHDQGRLVNMDAGSWSWFDIVVLDSPQSKKIKIKDGLALVWFSHDNKLGGKDDVAQTGPTLSGRHDILSSLEAGNALGVRVCARFPGWENHASVARLMLQVPDKVPDSLPRQPTLVPSRSKKDYIALVANQVNSLTQTFDKYLNAATPDGVPPAYSRVREMLPTGPLRADQVAVTEKAPLRLLSFDGGGVRGISSLYILQAIMAKVSPDPNVKPCKYFDMICGTSTGGLIAIMLGRLQMTIPECISAYMSFASAIFSANLIERTFNFSTTGAYYKSDNFEAALKEVIKSKTNDENALMLDPDSTNCKVFVVAGRSQDLSSSAEHFRTYRTKFPDPFATCTIWQAARATSAAPVYLPPMRINNTEFIDGGLRFNNPSILLMGEVNAIFGLNDAGFGIARPIGCLLSIGTGRQPNIKISPQPDNPAEAAIYATSIAAASVRLATDSETTNNLMMDLFAGKDDVYYRFNAGIPAGNDWAPLILIDDYHGMPNLVAVTQTYLVGQANRVAQCAQTLLSALL